MLFVLPADATILPLEAPAGTVAVILEPLQDCTVIGIPFKETPPDPWLAPKFNPEIVMVAPGDPVFGEMAVIDGAAPQL